MKVAHFHWALSARKYYRTRQRSRQSEVETSQLTTATYQIKNDYFQRLLDSQNKQRKVFEKKVTVSEKTQEASYLVAELLSQH
jgi:hypothetical protein